MTGVDGVKGKAEGQEKKHPREDVPHRPLDAEGRVRLFMELYPHPSISGEIVSDDRFRSEEWPRRMYALAREDLVEVLRDLEIYEDELSKANARAIQDAKRIDRLEKSLKTKEDLVDSMRLNGARHHFAYAYQKHDGTRFVDHCKVCDKEQEHPAHFFQKAKYLDSRDVDKAAQEALGRVQGFLESGLSMPEERARKVALELLQALPGIEPEEESG